MGTFTKYSYTTMAANVDGYWVYMPTGASSASACIIGWHGLGEQGDGGPTQLDLVVTQGFPKLINDRMGTGSEFPYDCICIFPQYIGTPLSGLAFQNVINYVRANFTFDQNKLHITGYSNGAACVASWFEVGTLTHVASCSIVATSLGYSASAAPRLVSANMPCLFNHGDLDTGSTDYTKSTGWVSGLNTDGIIPAAVLDTLEDAGHNVDETIYDWTWYEPVTGLTQIEWHLQYSRSSATLTHDVFYKNGSQMNRLLMYSDNTWVQQQFISGAWTSVTKQAMQVRWKVGSTLYRANLTTGNYTIL